MSLRTRRRVLLDAAALAVAGSASARAGVAAGRSLDDAVVDALRRSVAVADVAALGRTFLAGARVIDPAALGRALLPSVAARRRFVGAADARRVRMLRALIDADFESGRIEVVEGWVLSRTEALLSAVAATR